MEKSWSKASVSLTMVGEGHETGIKRTFNNIKQDVSAEQVIGFGKVLESLTQDQLLEGHVTDSHLVVG